MKNLAISFLLTLTLLQLESNKIFADDPYPLVEILVGNHQSTPIYARFYPVGAVFNGHLDPGGPTYYSLITIVGLTGQLRRGGPTQYPLTYIIGLDGYALNNRGPCLGYFQIIYDPTPGNPDYSKWLLLGDDATGGNSGNADGLIGRGKYVLELHKLIGCAGGDESSLICPPINIDWLDFNYLLTLPNQSKDLILRIYSISPNPLLIKFQWEGGGVSGGDEISLFDPNLPSEDQGNLKIWRQYKHWTGTQWQGYNLPPSTPPNLGNSLSDPNPANRNYPLDGKNLPQPYTIPRHDNPDLLGANLTVQQNHLVNILAGKLVTLQTGATLSLMTNSTLYLQSNSILRIKNGAYLCNNGGRISGPGQIIFEGLARCAGNVDHLFKDSTQVVLLDSAVWEINDSSTVTFEGNVTSLTLKPNSKIKFGKNSKLIFKTGAHLRADSSVFTSLNTSDTWNGIYLQDVSNDTIKYCTIENATTGVNIINKSSWTPIQPSTEISNCTFSNITTTQLTNGVYISNSNNILFRYNIFTSSQINNGFGTGVNIEYCPPGSFNILDNTINKVVTGITVIQSSPYIARNTITGQTGTGKGFNLDNSNGTIEYNTVNNFQYSFYALYSSPYLLKNNFNNTSSRNIDLYSNSIPLMRPINSGSLLRWLSGNNSINGTPSQSGLGFTSDSYPVMDSGYNKVVLTNGADYMNGAIPSSLPGGLNAIYNFWNDQPPVPAKFNVTGGSVIYNPWHNGSPSPPTDYYELNSIGFGLDDSVFVENLGDNHGSEVLFMQAYRSEMLGQYINAIVLYKNVIVYHPNSSYAAISLSRIFNCLEKNRSAGNEYLSHQNYLNLIKNNPLYSMGLRELAEDFIIKSKVRREMLNDAISDYELMYQQNQNNTKGQHALINKQCLIRMRDNNYGGQSPNGFMLTQQDNSNQTNNNIPEEYKLFQNYPNPFNPITTIKYDLPYDGIVKLSVYNLMGEEIYSEQKYRTAGTYNFIFNGSQFASGLYFYKVESGSFSETKKMVLLK